MTDPSISPNSKGEFRIICVTEDSWHDDDDEDSGSFGAIESPLDPILLKKIDDKNWRNRACVTMVEYNAPHGYECLVGQGLLWEQLVHYSPSDCKWAVQRKIQNKWITAHESL